MVARYQSAYVEHGDDEHVMTVDMIVILIVVFTSVYYEYAGGVSIESEKDEEQEPARYRIVDSCFVVLTM